MTKESAPKDRAGQVNRPIVTKARARLPPDLLFFLYMTWKQGLLVDHSFTLFVLLSPK